MSMPGWFDTDLVVPLWFDPDSNRRAWFDKDLVAAGGAPPTVAIGWIPRFPDFIPDPMRASVAYY